MKRSQIYHLGNIYNFKFNQNTRGYGVERIRLYTWTDVGIKGLCFV